MSVDNPLSDAQAQPAAIALGALSLGATEERVEDQGQLVERDAWAGVRGKNFSPGQSAGDSVCQPLGSSF